MIKNAFRKICAAVLCLTAAAGCLSLSACGKEVNTYDVSNLAYVDEWINTSESYGEVSTYNMQNIFGTDTMKIKEVYV